jgi:hypothetical protein
VAIGQARCT